MIEQPYKGKQTKTEDLEEEVKRLQEERLKASEDPEEVLLQKAVEDPNLSEDEKTYAKRYGDLRRHTQKIQDEFKAREEELRAKLEEAQKVSYNSFPVGTSEEELANWKEEHPEIAKIVEAIAAKQAKTASSQTAEQLEQQIAKLREQNDKLTKQEALSKVKQAHPDFDELSTDLRFHQWVDEQTEQGVEWVARAIYNSTNATDAIKAITLYKAEKGLLFPKEPSKDLGLEQKEKEREAAKSVSERNNPEVHEQKKKRALTDKEIKSMDDEAFLKWYKQQKGAA